MTTWLITGCSSGLGHALATTVLEAGFNAVVTARDADSVQDLVAGYPDTALAVALDVTDKQAIARAVDAAQARFGAIDVLVNNAGYGYRAAVEEGEDEPIAKLFATNVFGPVAMIQAVLPDMRKRRSGAIINLSSIAGLSASAGSGFYSATKMAIEGISDALRKEVSPLGIKVMIVQPGAFRTDFAGRSLVGARTKIDDYADTAGRRRKENDKTHGTQPGDPERGARAILEAISKAEPPLRLLLGSDAIRFGLETVSIHAAEIEAWAAISVKTDFVRAEQQ